MQPWLVLRRRCGAVHQLLSRFFPRSPWKHLMQGLPDGIILPRGCIGGTTMPWRYLLKHEWSSIEQLLHPCRTGFLGTKRLFDA